MVKSASSGISAATGQDAAILHPSTAASITLMASKPTHAILITGPAGSGKATIACLLGTKLIGIESGRLATYPYYKNISPVDNKAIPIESIRELQHLLALKIPGRNNLSQEMSRIIIIEDAQLMTTEAQNALLKTLEEPPADTVIILTATSKEALLPTIQSRVRPLRAIPPSGNALRQHFEAQGFQTPEIEKSLMLSGGLPGLAYALLANQQSHPLYAATIQARELLQASAYQRLVLADGLSKQKQLAQDVCFILGSMARTALLRSQQVKPGASTDRWRKIMQASYLAQEQFRSNAQPKLILINLMLAL